MKTYVTENSLRMVGKAWQIRAMLRQFSESNATLQQFLSANSASSSTRPA
ncbi:MAG: Z-ring formation inhibitor MciZ [Tumebacillaceae bacterium]|jgi:Mother cell inhibitor of FtsZ